MRSRKPLTLAQRLVVVHAAAMGRLIEPDPLVPITVYRSLCWPHGLLRELKGGFVITPGGRAAAATRSNSTSNDDWMEAAE